MSYGYMLDLCWGLRVLRKRPSISKNTSKVECHKLLSKMLPGIRELELTNDENGGDFMKDLTNAKLPCLWKLSISGYGFQGENVTFHIGKAARNFPKLEDLEAFHCKIEISDSDQQFDFPCLQKLKLVNVEIDDYTINTLAANLPVYIDLPKCLTK